MSSSLERVTCKAALYTPDHLKVLLVEYGPGDFGLPGGHLDSDEAPEDAVRRELREELGLVAVGELKRCDFWKHPHYSKHRKQKTPYEWWATRDLVTCRDPGISRLRA